MRRRLIAVLAGAALSSFGLFGFAAPASAGPYCNDIDVVWCVVLHGVETVDCKVNKNC